MRNSSVAPGGAPTADPAATSAITTAAPTTMRVRMAPPSGWFQCAESSARESWSRGRRRLPDQAGEPPVGQDFAAGLARRTVGDLVRLVRDPAEVFAASRTGRPVLTVDGEVVPDPRRQAAGTTALDLEGVGQDRVERLEQLAAFPLRERTKRRV